jgi:hypothetical protein
MSSIVAGNNAFSHAFDITLDQQTGTLFVSDFLNQNIRKITPKGKSVFFFFFFNSSRIMIEYFDQEKCQQLLELE